MSYDVKCSLLAAAFLSDHKSYYEQHPEALDRLAQHIQMAIEDWLSNELPDEAMTRMRAPMGRG